MAYPTTGIELIVPSKATLPFEGWGARFARRGREYEVRFLLSGLSITVDGEKVKRWDDVPKRVQQLIIKTRDNYSDSRI